MQSSQKREAIKVLIVEDNKGVLDFWQRCFAEQPWPELGLQFLWAATLGEAMNVFSSNQDVTLVVMDWYLKKPSGFTDTTLELVQWMRKQGFTGPMIATSSDSEYQEVLKGAGCSHACDKGHLPEELRKVLGL